MTDCVMRRANHGGGAASRALHNDEANGDETTLLGSLYQLENFVLSVNLEPYQ